MTTIIMTSVVPAFLQDLFDFHMDFSNVRIVTPSFITTRFVSVPVRMKEGSAIVVEVGMLGILQRWELTVRTVDRPTLLVDEQTGRGPFAAWRHEHSFTEENGTVMLTDRIQYRMRGGPLGHLVDVLLLRRLHRRLFEFRHQRTIAYFLAR